MKMSDLKVSDTLYPDAGFTCMSVNSSKQVCEDDGGLYVECDDGKHYLEGQLDFEDGETLVGLASERWST